MELVYDLSSDNYGMDKDKNERKYEDWAQYYKNRTLDEIMEDNYDGERK